MGRSVATSVTAPSAPTRRGARISATQNEWVAPTTAIPAYAPSMYSSPWAKFITQQPEDHGQAQRQEPQRGPEDEAVQELRQQDRDEIIQRLLVLLLELPGEPFHRVLADHRLAD